MIGVSVVHVLLEELCLVRVHLFKRCQGLSSLVVIIPSVEADEGAQIENV